MPLFFSDVKPLLALLLHCRKSNINIESMAIMEDPYSALQFHYFAGTLKNFF
jgi:hypothetical protein